MKLSLLFIGLFAVFIVAGQVKIDAGNVDTTGAAKGRLVTAQDLANIVFTALASKPDTSIIMPKTAINAALSSMAAQVNSKVTITAYNLNNTARTAHNDSLYMTYDSAGKAIATMQGLISTKQPLLPGTPLYAVPASYGTIVYNDSRYATLAAQQADAAAIAGKQPLGNYLLPADTVGKFQAKGSYLKPADTISRFQPKGNYLTPVDTVGRFQQQGSYQSTLPTGYLLGYSLGNITVSQTATIAIAAGLRTVTITGITGLSAGDRVFLTPTTSLPAGYSISGNPVAVSSGTLEVTVTAPALAIGASYSVVCKATVFR